MTAEDLEKLRTWVDPDLHEIMSFIHGIWEHSDWGWEVQDNIYWMSVGVSKTNQDIIMALLDNQPFWSHYWFSTRRGGHYIFCSTDEFPLDVRGFLTYQDGKLVRRELGDLGDSNGQQQPQEIHPE